MSAPAALPALDLSRAYRDQVENSFSELWDAAQTAAYTDTANTFALLQTFTTGIATNAIAERTAAAGVTIDSVLLKDGKGTFSGGVGTDSVVERTAGAGVTIDSVLLKDGGATLTAALVGTSATLSGTATIVGVTILGAAAATDPTGTAGAEVKIEGKGYVKGGAGATASGSTTAYYGGGRDYTTGTYGPFGGDGQGDGGGGGRAGLIMIGGSPTHEQDGAGAGAVALGGDAIMAGGGSGTRPGGGVGLYARGGLNGNDGGGGYGGEGKRAPAIYAAGTVIIGSELGAPVPNGLTSVYDLVLGNLGILAIKAVAAPGTNASYGLQYLDATTGDLMFRFPNGTLATLATN